MASFLNSITALSELLKPPEDDDSSSDVSRYFLLEKERVLLKVIGRSYFGLF